MGRDGDLSRLYQLCDRDAINQDAINQDAINRRLYESHPRSTGLNLFKIILQVVLDSTSLSRVIGIKTKAIYRTTAQGLYELFFENLVIVFCAVRIEYKEYKEVKK